MLLDVSNIAFKSIYYSDYQDHFVMFLHHSPELSLAVLDFIDLEVNDANINSKPHVVFDMFNDTLHNTLSEFLDSFVSAYITT